MGRAAPKDALRPIRVKVPEARANRPLREQIHRMLAGHDVGHERFFPSASAAVDDFLATVEAKPH